MTLILAMSIWMTAGCSQARSQKAGPPETVPRMTHESVITTDGYRLPLRQWLPDEAPEAVILGLHGFSDYGNGFYPLDDALVKNNQMAIYAYDQRGFGATADPGIWPGEDTLVADARAVVSLLRQRHPDTPLYLIGDSMGAAVVLLVLSRDNLPPVDGAILISPAVWGFDAMAWYQRLAMWLGMRVMPGHAFSSETPRKLGIRPTDDEAVMREMMADPLMQKSARMDTLHGLTELMTAASRVTELPVPALVLHAPDDLIIPANAMCQWLGRLAEKPPANLRIALYPDGYHMLTRYSGSDRVLADIAAWLRNREGELPSGTETNIDRALSLVCRD